MKLIWRQGYCQCIIDYQNNDINYCENELVQMTERNAFFKGYMQAYNDITKRLILYQKEYQK